jgi:type I restriction enzyme S subunit
MEKDSTSSAMPRLRFPAFRNAQDWDEKKAGSVFANRIEEGEEGLPIYSVTMHDGMVKRDFFDRDFYDIEDAGGNKKAHRNDITYNMMRMWQGASGVAMEDCMVSPAYVVLAPKEGVRSDFYAYLFKLPQYLRVLTAHSQGLTKDRLRLYYKDFAQIPLPLPSPTEQQKIADCLTSLDEAIAALGRKLAALADHKRGLMQQLFPREGETLPRLRFPEFRDAPEWVISRFDELYTFPPTNTFSRDQLSDSEGTIRNIHYGDIHTKFAASFRIRREQVPSVAPLISLVKNKSKAFCREGDMIFADASEDLNDVGKCIEIVELNGKLLLSGSHTILARRIGNKLAVGFGAYLFKSRNVRAQIENEAQGTKVMAISPNRLARIGVRYPVQLSEQQRIADCLSFLDARLAAEGEKLTALKTHKKGLMQQLFPAIDATKDVSAVEETATPSQRGYSQGRQRSRSRSARHDTSTQTVPDRIRTPALGRGDSAALSSASDNGPR